MALNKHYLEDATILEIGVDDLVSRTDLEKETIEEVFRILKAEFE